LWIIEAAVPLAGTAVFFIDSIGPSRLGRKNHRKEKEKTVKAKRMKGKNVILYILSAVRKKENK